MLIDGSLITTTVDLESGGIKFPIGTKGTVVHVYPGSQAFEVEFSEHDYNMVVTVMYHQLELFADDKKRAE